MLYSILEGDGIMIKLMALGLLFSETGCASLLGGGKLTWVRGGIERGPTDEKKISLVFTGGSFGEGGEHILNVLKKHGIKGSFFFTGDFFRTREFEQIEIEYFCKPGTDTEYFEIWLDESRKFLTEVL